jgi:hypothetical protein
VWLDHRNTLAMEVLLTLLDKHGASRVQDALMRVELSDADRALAHRKPPGGDSDGGDGGGASAVRCLVHENAAKIVMQARTQLSSPALPTLSAMKPLQSSASISRFARLPQLGSSPLGA